MAITTSTNIDLSQTLDFMRDLGNELNATTSLLGDLGGEFADAFDDNKMSAFADAFKTLEKTANRVKLAFGGIFSILRNILLLPLNGLLSGLGKAFDWLKNGVNGSLSQNFNADVLGTKSNTLKQLEWAERYAGTDGLIQSGVTAFRQSINDPSKQKAYLSLGATNADLDKWQKGDSVEGFFDFLKKSKSLNYDIGSRSFYESVGGSDTGLSFEEYLTMTKRVGEVEAEFHKIQQTLSRDGKAMENAERSLIDLNLAFESVRNKLITAFSPVISDIARVAGDVINSLSRDLLKKESVESFGRLLQQMAKDFADFVKSDGLEMFKNAIVSLARVVSEIMYFIIEGGKKIGLFASVDLSQNALFKNIHAEKQLASDFAEVYNRDNLKTNFKLAQRQFEDGTAPKFDEFDYNGKIAYAGDVAQNMTSLEAIRKLQDKGYIASDSVKKIFGDEKQFFADFGKNYQRGESERVTIEVKGNKVLAIKTNKQGRQSFTEILRIEGENR